MEYFCSDSPGSAGTDAGWGGNLNSQLVDNCVRMFLPKLLKSGHPSSSCMQLIMSGILWTRCCWKLAVSPNNHRHYRSTTTATELPR